MRSLVILNLILFISQSFAQDPGVTITTTETPSTNPVVAAPNAEDPSDEFGIKALMEIRDPFIRPKFSMSSVVRTELERFETQEYELSAIITGPNQMRAMILDPEGKSHFVKVGDKIGKKEGVIIQIGESEISIRERDVDYFGNKKTIMAKLIISESDSINSNDSRTKTADGGEQGGFSRFSSEALDEGEDDAPMNAPQSGSAPIPPRQSAPPPIAPRGAPAAGAGTTQIIGGETAVPKAAPTPGQSWQKYTR